MAKRFQTRFPTNKTLKYVEQTFNFTFKNVVLSLGFTNIELGVEPRECIAIRELFNGMHYAKGIALVPGKTFIIESPLL